MSERWLVIGAFAAIYFIWGSTYVFNYWAIETIPPFLMSASRFMAAGALLYAWGLFKGESSPSLKEWGNAFLMGNLFLSIGTGAVVWAMQWIDTNVAALLITFDPMLIMLMMWILLGQRPKGAAIIGAVIATIGMLLLIDQPQFSDSPEARFALVVVAIALVSWGLASIYVSRVSLPKSRLRSSAMQMLAGGFGLLLYSGYAGEFKGFSIWAVNQSSAWSWLYLVLFGSIIAFSSFNYLLTKVSPEKVATNTYVNPIVALTLGWAFNNEVITSQSLLAAGVLITGVFFINKK